MDSGGNHCAIFNVSIGNHCSLQVQDCFELRMVMHFMDSGTPSTSAMALDCLYELAMGGSRSKRQCVLLFYCCFGLSRGAHSESQLRIWQAVEESRASCS